MQLHSSCFLVSPGWSFSSHLQPSSQSCSHEPPLPYRPLGGPLCIAPSLPMPYSADSSHLSYATLCSLLLCLTSRLCVNFNTVVRKLSPGRGLPFSFPLSRITVYGLPVVYCLQIVASNISTPFYRCS